MEGGKLTAGHVEEGAVDGGDPEVGGASVKEHREVLWRSADTDHPVVLGLGGHSKQGGNVELKCSPKVFSDPTI